MAGEILGIFAIFSAIFSAMRSCRDLTTHSLIIAISFRDIFREKFVEKSPESSRGEMRA